MKGITIEAARVKAKPKYGVLAAELLEKCRGFYEDPENEKAFRAWKDGERAEEQDAVR